MKQRVLETIKDIIHIERNHWIFLPVVVTISHFLLSLTGEESPVLLLWTVWGIFPVGFYVLRMKLQRFIPFLLAHLGLVLLVILVPGGTTDRIMGGCIVLFYAARSFYLRLKGNIPPGAVHPAVAIGISVFCTYLQHYLGTRRWDTVQLLVITGGMILFLVLYYMEHYLEFLSFNESSAGYLPAAEMFRSGMGLVSVYTLAGAFLLLLGTNATWLETIVNAIKSLLLSGLRFLFSLIPDQKAQEAVPQVEEPLPGDSGGMEEWLPEGGEPSLIWEILEVVVILALVCGLLYLGLRLLVWVIRFIRSHFVAGPGREEAVSDSIQDHREKCDAPGKKAGSRQNFWAFLSPGERIRRRYKKKLITHADTLSPGNVPGLGLLTPRESAEKLCCMDMASIYEKVRYTEEPVTEEMVRNMRRASQ